MSVVTMYTDGACSGNPGPGGWGVVLLWNDHRKELKGGEMESTNNRMELLAVIQGAESLKRGCDLHIYTDSTYVMKGITEWIENWKARDWRTASKSPVANRELWERLEAALKRHSVKWHWVKGHSGVPENERADELARQGIPS